MDEIIDALAGQHAELDRLLSGLDEPGWQRPSQCEGWTIADVVTHLAQTDAMAIASLRDQFVEFLAEVGRDLPPATSVDEGVESMVSRERGTPVAEVRERWQTAAATLVESLRSTDPHKRVQWVVGELSAQTLATTRLAECWIHTGDVAYGLGVNLEPTERLKHIARLAWRTLPYAFATAGRELSGPVAFRLTGPGGDRWDFLPTSGEATTTITGDALELCLVAGRRVAADATSLQGSGPDAAAVVELVRTYAA